MMKLAPGWVFICFLSLALLARARLTPDQKCSACTIVFDELERNMAKEVQNQKIDLRSRLDSTGKRRGKVLDYKLSESRIDDLLGPICKRMAKYSIYKLKNSKIVQYHTGDFKTKAESKRFENYEIPEKSWAETTSRELDNYCDVFVEEGEDAFAEDIRADVPIRVMKKRHCGKLCKAYDKKVGKWEKTHAKYLKKEAEKEKKEKAERKQQKKDKTKEKTEFAEEAPTLDEDELEALKKGEALIKEGTRANKEDL